MRAILILLIRRRGGSSSSMKIIIIIRIYLLRVNILEASKAPLSGGIDLSIKIISSRIRK
jgi:hypothetical protein